MCCSPSRRALKGNPALQVKPEKVFPGRMKPISWTQNTVVLFRPGTKSRTMKEGEAAHFLIREANPPLQIFISLESYLYVLHPLPIWVKFPLPSPPTPIAFPYEPVWGQSQSVRQTLQTPRKSEAGVLTSLQHLWSLQHYKLQFLFVCSNVTFQEMLRTI